MAARASWKGHIRLSLISIPVRLYNATSSSSHVPLRMLHKGCHQRLQQQMVCPEHGNVSRQETVKGYEYEKDRYVIIEEADLEQIKLETNRTVDLVQFVSKEEVDPIYLDAPYYVTPDGPVAEEAFRVVREAMRAADKLGIGRVVLSGKEQMVALKVQDKGFCLTTMRYAHEVRSAAPYFEDIRNGEIDSEQLDLAKRLVENYSAPLDPTQFKDRYHEALWELIRAKMEGAEPAAAPAAEERKVISLMDALKQSVEQTQSSSSGPSKKGKTAKKTPKKPPTSSTKTPRRSSKRKGA